MGNSLKIIGIDKLITKLKKNATLGDVKQVIKMNGSEMQQSAQRFAPVDTGSLKRNIRLNIEQWGMEAKVTSGAEYAGYQEWGTRYMSGTPHIKPAYRIQSAKFKADMQRLIK